MKCAPYYLANTYNRGIPQNAVENVMVCIFVFFKTDFRLTLFVRAGVAPKSEHA